MRLAMLCLLVACAGEGQGDDNGTGSTLPTAVPTGEEARANVDAVSTSGSAGAYTFAVTIRSDETGCEQYADWWEVVLPDGTLVYRRILNHSHPDDQPFTRDGGPVAIAADEEVIVRAHLHPGGYVGGMRRGTVDGGFSAMEADSTFAANVASQAPLPEDCWF